jgi:arabinose-5-phosphate isomerase
MSEGAIETGTRAMAAVERFLEVAVHELSAVATRMDRAQLANAANLIRKVEARGGRVHVTGIGKPEHVAHYAASLLASTGTAATFLHGTEVTHGCLGQLRSGDLVIAISNSGRTPELIAAVEAMRRFGTRLVAVTGALDSPLARLADVVLEARVGEEGDPLGFAPRASVLAEVLVLAALSVELQVERGFTRADYHARHPAGALGEKSRA